MYHKTKRSSILCTVRLFFSYFSNYLFSFCDSLPSFTLCMIMVLKASSLHIFSSFSESSPLQPPQPILLNMLVVPTVLFLSLPALTFKYLFLPGCWLLPVEQAIGTTCSALHYLSSKLLLPNFPIFTDDTMSSKPKIFGSYLEFFLPHFSHPVPEIRSNVARCLVQSATYQLYELGQVTQCPCACVLSGCLDD